MKKIITTILLLLLSSCASVKQSQTKKQLCKKASAYSAGKAAAAMKESINYKNYEICDEPVKSELIDIYKKSYVNYKTNEENKVGMFDGSAGFGASISNVCIGTIFGISHIGKGKNEPAARGHLRGNCIASDSNIHCSNMFVRCRTINFSNQIK